MQEKNRLNRFHISEDCAMGWKTLDDMDLNGKRVLVRVDINVPVVDGVVTDATRIQRIVPTVRDILAAGGKPILLAHFGRPGGERRENLSLKQLVPTLEGMPLGPRSCLPPIASATEAELAADALQPGQVLLLENTRFHAAETKNDADLAAGMAKSGRCLLQRCLLGRAPRPQLDRGAGPPAARLCRSPDAGRT